MTKHVISCRPDGVIEGVQNDELPLHEIGNSTMTRASDVIWGVDLAAGKDEQLWTAIIRPEFRHGDGPHLFSNKSRQACIDWEISYLNNR